MTLLAGKRGLIMGVANDHSIAYGIAQHCAKAGASLALTYQNEMLAKRVNPLAESLGADLTLPCDVSIEGGIDTAMDTLAKSWDRIDFVVHAIAFADKNELRGAYLNTSRENFTSSMMVSCYSLTELARASLPFMKDNGGSIMTLTYLGANRITPNYNVMGVAKAALEASVRYLAVDLGKYNIRVNAISAGPVKTLAGATISGARHVYRHSEQNAPLHRNPDMDEVGRSGLYFASDLSSGVSGEVHYVDGGYNHIGVPQPSAD
ncbi:MAG: SDR family oxidoreductase [Alphaproteobacteria bacterium]|nr:SDR family oxidoreductase [Alphaproteobacteria bacterium]